MRQPPTPPTRAPQTLRRARPLQRALAGLGILIVSGCGASNELETGYAFQPLNSTAVERRAFYADPYSLEARKAESERREASRPTPFGAGGN